MASKIFSVNNRKGRFLAPASAKTWIMKNKCQKNWKFAQFVKQNAKIRDVKMLKPFHYH